MVTAPLTLTSPAFAHEGEIPRVYTCEGRNIAPPLVFAGVPGPARSLALVLHDPDVPDPRQPRRIWVHWVLYDLPPTTKTLAEAATAVSLPPGTREGTNDWHQTGYGGPCPPVGRHRYIHTLYALDVVLPDLHRPTRAALLSAMARHVLAEATLIGTYEKTR
jgi:Raf kinase inhibitor-like YbhB/YbcL family protein